MSKSYSQVQKTDCAHEFFERVRMSNPNQIIRDQVSRIENVFASSGVIFFGSLQDMKLDKVRTLLREAQPPLDETWAATLEQFMDTKFKTDTDTVDSPTEMTGAAVHPRGEVAAPKLVSPGKPVVMLGAMLTHANRLYEIKSVYTKEQFLDIFIANPQIFDGEVLKPKMDEKITKTCVLLAAIKWGILNWDKTFCNIVAGILRDFGFRLPKRGTTPGFKRDFANVLLYKASSVRNKILKATSDGGLYKTVFVLAPEDCTEAIGRLQEKGLMVTVDKSKSGLFNEEVLKAKSMQLEELEKTYHESKKEVRARLHPIRAPHSTPLAAYSTRARTHTLTLALTLASPGVIAAGAAQIRAHQVGHALVRRHHLFGDGGLAEWSQSYLASYHAWQG